MAVFSPAANRPLQGGKGSSPGFRFTLYALASIALMFLDQKQHYLDQARYLLEGVAYPVQLAVSSPTKAITFLQDNMQARDVLAKENEELKNHQHELSLQVMRMDALERENGELRGLKDGLPPVADRWLVGEIVLQVDSLRQRVLINRGNSNGVFKGQTVIDDAGVVGQTTEVGPWSSEVILITDPEHAIPVVIERTGKNTIAEGAGDQATLVLPFLAANEDVKDGDRLSTSGLGGVFPAGYPVGKVELHKESTDPRVRFRVVPTARIATDREVVLVWFREGHPAAPVEVAPNGQLRTGNPDMLPQPAPPKPKPVEPPAATAAPPAADTAPPAAAPAAQASSSPTTAKPVLKPVSAQPPKPTAAASSSHSSAAGSHSGSASATSHSASATSGSSQTSVSSRSQQSPGGPQ